MNQWSRQPVEERFWAKVERRGEDECWLWKGLRCRDGYGKFNIQREKRWTTVVASRMALELSGVVIPTGFYALHHCDNPACCNPKHLRAGTQQDNGRDMTSRNRSAKGARHGSRTKPETTLRGEKHGGAKLRDDDVLEIKRRLANNEKRKDLATLFGAKIYTIHSIASNRQWSHVPWPAGAPAAAPALDAPQHAPASVDWSTAREVLK